MSHPPVIEWTRAVQKLWGRFGPRRRGRWFLEGLADNVEVLTDQWGVPRVSAGSWEDAFLVQGYLHARERAFQLDMQRRIASGRLAEALGPAALPADRFLRKLGLPRRSQELWADLDPRSQKLLLAYARGVNQGLARLRPLECWALGVRIEPWNAIDSLLWSQMMSFDMGNNWESEWLRWDLLRQLGADRAQQFLLHPPGESLDLGALRVEYEAARDALQHWTQWGGGSNAWAVAPGRSASGHPLLGSDPHLHGKSPSTFFEIALEAPGLQLYGASLPGIPGVIIGHSATLSWGITNAYVDTQDLTLEQLTPDHGYLRPGGALPLRRREEVIRVKGQADVRETVWETESGPLLFQDPGGRLAMSLRWSGWSGRDHTVPAWFGLFEARGVEDAQKVLERWNGPCLNFILADTAGNIGYQMAGKVPTRNGTRGILPQSGWSELGAWTGWIPRQQLPSQLNPECGYVISANDRPPGASPELGGDFCDPYRAWRIAERLSAPGALTLDDMARLQTDTVSQPARQFLGLLGRDGWPQGPRPELLLELQQWDGDLAAGSRAAACYQVWLWHILNLAYGEELGEALFLRWCGAASSPISTLAGQAGRCITFLLGQWQAATLPGAELARRAWPLALAELSESLGPEASEWRWGRLHRFRPYHPMAAASALFGTPLLEVGGDVSTVQQTTLMPNARWETRAWMPSYRLVAELAPTVQSRSVLPTGQSGWVGDQHQFDQGALWAQGELHPGIWDRRSLERSRPERLVLLARRRPTPPGPA